MKKTLLSVAIVMGTLLGGTVSVNAQTAADKAKTEQSCAKGNSCDKAQPCNLFEGIKLSDKQQAELKNLKEEMQKECAAKATKIKADQKQRNEQRKGQAQAMKQKRQAERKAYLERIKGILTEQQYVQYLENCYMNTPQQGGRKAKGPKMAKNRKNVHKHANAAKGGLTHNRQGKGNLKPGQNAKADAAK